MSCGTRNKGWRPRKRAWSSRSSSWTPAQAWYRTLLWSQPLPSPLPKGRQLLVTSWWCLWLATLGSRCGSSCHLLMLTPQMTPSLALLSHKQAKRWKLERGDAALHWFKSSSVRSAVGVVDSRTWKVICVSVSSWHGWSDGTVVYYMVNKFRHLYQMRIICCSTISPLSPLHRGRSMFLTCENWWQVPRLIDDRAPASSFKKRKLQGVVDGCAVHRCGACCVSYNVFTTTLQDVLTHVLLPEMYWLSVFHLSD